MNQRAFLAIASAMEKDLEGCGYFVRLRLIDGSTVFGAIGARSTTNAVRIERASEPKVGTDEFEQRPDVYVPYSSIIAVEGPLLDWKER